MRRIILLQLISLLLSSICWSAPVPDPRAIPDGMQSYNDFEKTISRYPYVALKERGAKIVAGLKKQVPVIVFSKGTHGNWNDLAGTGANVLGVDWNIQLSDVAARLPAHIGVQGNMDPFLLSTTPEVVAAEAGRILREMGGRPGHVFNLGHGVPPTAKLENIESLVRTVRGYK